MSHANSTPESPDRIGSDRKQASGEKPEEPGLETFGIVGVGASAGGLEAFSDVLKALPADTGLAFVLVMHLDPHHPSFLAEVLANRTAMPVSRITDKTTVQPNHVYVIPPNMTVELVGRMLVLAPRAPTGVPNPIDVFFMSLAREMRANSTAVVLSGTASDGTLGLKEIKAAGGITFCQDRSAKYDGMPRTAIATGVVDFILPPEQIAAELAVLAKHPAYSRRESFAKQQDGAALQRVLDLMRARTSVDFSQYKQPTIQRRLARRLTLRKIEDLESYLSVLREEPGELNALLDDLLINVTEFFRDPEAFEQLKKAVFPAIFSKLSPHETLRIWVPGCSSGEEVYSIAIVLLEYFRERNLDQAVRIFATDVSDGIIDKARSGTYAESAVTGVSPERLKRFFSRCDSGYQINRPVREMCIFSRQNIARDSPLSRMDLISCRNLLIYFNASLQNRVLSTFAYSLKPSGCLLLGSSETVGSLGAYFTIVDAKHKIYCLKPDVPKSALVQPSPATGPSFLSPPEISAHKRVAREDSQDVQRYIDRVLLTHLGPGTLVVDKDLNVTEFRGDINRFLDTRNELDANLFDLTGEQLEAPLRIAIESARGHRTTVRLESVEMQDREQKTFRANITVVPVCLPDADLYFAILFEDAPGPAPKSKKSEKPTGRVKPLDAQQHIRHLEDELVSTRQYLQTIIEELRSANEEAQSANEELQSTNEELQTAKEEMQSSNEELHTINAEMQSRNADLAQLNDDLTNLLSSMSMPVLMVSHDLRIRRFTPKAELVLRLIASDVGRPISDLQPRINVPNLEPILRDVLDTLRPHEQEVQDQEGHWHLLRVRPYRTSDHRIDGAVLQLVDIGELKQTLERVREARDYAQAIVDTVAAPLVILSEIGQIQDANQSFYSYFQTSPSAVAGRNILDLGPGPLSHPALTRLLRDVAANEPVVQDAEIEFEVAGRGTRVLRVNARRMPKAGRRQPQTLLAFEDVTAQKTAAEERYRRLFEAATDGIVIVDVATGNIADVNPHVERLFGYSREELVSRKFWDAPLLRSFPESKEALERIAQQGAVRFSDVTLYAKEGRELQLEVVGNIYSEEPGLRRVIQFNMRDLTDRRKFERELQHTAKLESLGLLAGGIAHDFNNLLTGILGNASLIHSDLAVGDLKRSFADAIVKAAERAALLTRQMLAYSGKGRFVMQRINVIEFIRDSLPLIQTSIPKTVDIILNLSDKTPEIEADAGQLQQVFMNLVINGAEAIGEGEPGRVEVRCDSVILTKEDVEEHYRIDQLSPGEYACIEVQDTGSGMDETTKARIFDPFFTTKFTGRGLGLAAVEGIVRGHRGAVRVQSTPGEGSTFGVLLPAAPGRALKGIRRAETRTEAPPRTILVIDDEPLMRDTARHMLERGGHRVLTAENGEVGLEVFRAHQDQIDLVLLDLLMPVMGGEETRKRILALRADVSIVLMSGFEESEVTRRVGERVAFIHKPFTVKDLLGVIQRS
jgi:two-component system CheB/CheR fusion protein